MENEIINFIRPNKSVAWGFSIQGGKEFGCPLSVLKVTPQSIADGLGIIVGDFIIKINDIPTESLTHQQAILQIQKLEVILEIKRLKNDTSEKNVIENLPPPPPLTPVNFNENCRISNSNGKLHSPPTAFLPKTFPSHASPSSLYNITQRQNPALQPLNPLSLSIHPPPQSIYPPPQPLYPLPKCFPKISQSKVLLQPKSHIVTHEKMFPLPGNFRYVENNSLENLSSVNFDSKEVEIIGEKNQIPAKSSASFGDFLHNHLNSQSRDSKDFVVQQTNLNKNIICFVCKDHIKGPYIEANKKIYCSDHFCCSYCSRTITSNQFIETKEGTLYCMEDFKNKIAPRCAKCSNPVVEEQIVALGKCWHSCCFLCDHCKKPIPQGAFHVKEDGGTMTVFCERDYQEYYEIKCTGCSYAIDGDDKYLLVSGKNYHVSCFKK